MLPSFPRRARELSKHVECDLLVLSGKLKDNSEKISSVALLSPGCFESSLNDSSHLPREHPKLLITCSQFFVTLSGGIYSSFPFSHHLFILQSPQQSETILKSADSQSDWDFGPQRTGKTDRRLSGKLELCCVKLVLKGNIGAKKIQILINHQTLIHKHKKTKQTTSNL